MRSGGRGRRKDSRSSTGSSKTETWTNSYQETPSSAQSCWRWFYQTVISDSFIWLPCILMKILETPLNTEFLVIIVLVRCKLCPQQQQQQQPCLNNNNNLGEFSFNSSSSSLCSSTVSLPWWTDMSRSPSSVIVRAAVNEWNCTYEDQFFIILQIFMSFSVFSVSSSSTTRVAFISIKIVAHTLELLKHFYQMKLAKTKQQQHNRAVVNYFRCIIAKIFCNTDHCKLTSWHGLVETLLLHLQIQFFQTVSTSKVIRTLHLECLYLFLLLFWNLFETFWMN